MAHRPRPSGLPSDRILKPILGPREIDVDALVDHQHAGLRRVRRFLLVVSGIVGVLAAVVALTAGAAAASGIAVLLLAPLLFVLGVVHVAVMVTRPADDEAS